MSARAIPALLCTKVLGYVLIIFMSRRRAHKCDPYAMLLSW
jgi:hypothetical protein